MTDDAPRAAAGWYPGPDGTTRFWDGAQWLDVPFPESATTADDEIDEDDPEYIAALEAERARLRAEGRRRAWIGVVVLVLLVGGCSYLTSRGGSSSDAYDEYDAWQNCKAQMDKGLKAPATAGYPMVSELTWSGAAGKWTFTRAWVDSENSFGAKVRTYFDCTVTETGSDTVRVQVTPET